MAHRRWAYEDLLRLPYDGLRHEIIDGVHYASESLWTKEQRVIARLKALLHYPLRDVFFYSRGFNRTSMGTPELVIDILPERKTIYERRIRDGVIEHWLVLPAINRVEISQREGNRFVRTSAGGSLTTPLLPWFTITLCELFS